MKHFTEKEYEMFKEEAEKLGFNLTKKENFNPNNNTFDIEFSELEKAFGINIEKDNKNEKQALIEMAKVGEIKDLSIIIYTNDNGNIPHFHIVDTATWGNKFHSCVYIEEPKYFYHTGKEDKLNSKMRKELIKFLQAPDFEGIFNTNWDALLYEWNKNNNRKRIPKDIIMPNYLELK